MDFSFTEEQELLRNSIAKFLAGNYGFETRRKIVKSDLGWQPEYWKQFAELGLLAAPLPEAHGGLGGGPVDVLIVMEEFGKKIVVEPFVPTVVIGGGFLKRASAALQQQWLPKIAGGEAIFAFAYAEPNGRYNLAELATVAKKQGPNYVLNGRKAVVLAGPWADQLIVTARTAGGPRNEKGVTVFLVDRKSKGISARDYPTVDELRASEIAFENVEVPAANVIGEPDNGLPLVEQVTDEAIAATCAEACGAMKALVDATVDYSKTRKQFGVPIGKFQVLQHRMVDMFTAYEQSVSITYMLTLKLGESDAARKKAASAAKVQIGKASRFVGQSAVQIHGGMGMTEELSVGHYFARLSMIDAQFGNVDHHLRRYAALG